MNCISDRQSGRAVLPRYILYRCDKSEITMQAIADTMAAGGHTLIVCNQVERACGWYEMVRERFERQGARVLLYHSRYRYSDRSECHRRAIDSFRDGQGPVILIATQVAEMSLDLSADLLITEHASIPALIQRMGRANRRASREQPSAPKPVYIMPIQSHHPYETADLESAERWLTLLQSLDRPLSQSDLAAKFNEVEEERGVDIRRAMKDALKSAVLFSGVWETTVGKLRDDGQTVNVILEEDLTAHMEVNDLPPDAKWIAGHEVPILFRPELLGWKKLVRGRPVAPAHRVRYDYDSLTGRGTGARWGD